MAVARLRPIAAALLALSLGAASRAAPVTWSFTGTIVSGVGTVGSTPATSFVGAPIGGTIRLDDATADSSADPSSGLYLNSVPPGEFRVQVGGAVFSAPVGFYVGVTNDSAVFSGADILGVNRLQAFPYPGLPGLWVDYFSITLFDSSGTVFSSDALPSPPPSVASFDPGSRSMDVQGCTDAVFDGTSCGGSFSYILSGQLDSLTLPEPGRESPAVAALALAALLAARRR